MVNIIEYLPELVDNALFDGGNLELAKLVLCALVIFASAFPLLYFDVSIQQLIGFEIIIIIVLTGLGWMNIAIMLLIVLAISLSLATQSTKIFLGDK
jgi:hypothetical protein